MTHVHVARDFLWTFTTTSKMLYNEEALASVSLAISDCDGPGDSTDIESSAWLFIRNISVEAILSSVPPRTVQSVKPAVRGLFQKCCVVFRKLDEDPKDEAALKLCFLFPRILLSPVSLPSRGKSGIKSSKNHFPQISCLLMGSAGAAQ